MNVNGEKEKRHLTRFTAMFVQDDQIGHVVFPADFNQLLRRVEIKKRKKKWELD